MLLSGSPLSTVPLSSLSSTISIALSGTITSSTTETDIVAGGKTIILTLTGDTWVASGATFNAQRQNIINGLTSAQSELFGWNNVVKALQGVAGVVRTSNTVVTITLDAQLTYNITAQETITATVPGSALTLGVGAVAAPTFTVSIAGGGSNIKTINGLSKASVKAVNGLAIASVKTINGLA